MKIHPMGDELFRADKIDKTKLKFAIRNFANTPEKPLPPPPTMQYARFQFLLTFIRLILCCLRYWHDNSNRNDITDNAYPRNRK